MTIATAIASIPGTFVACVDCFQYVRLGKRFGKDFGVCLAKLEAAHMQLTRWGEPLGLLENKFDPKGAYNDTDIIHAKEWLGLILSAFQDAGDISTKYAERQKKKGKHQDLDLLNAETELESTPSMKQLYLSMKGVTTARQKHLSFPRKVTWALYGKDDLTELIEDLVGLINNLVNLFPSNKPRLQELGKQEVANLGKGPVLDLAELLTKMSSWIIPMIQFFTRQSANTSTATDLNLMTLRLTARPAKSLIWVIIMLGEQSRRQETSISRVWTSKAKETHMLGITSNEYLSQDRSYFVLYPS